VIKMTIELTPEKRGKGKLLSNIRQRISGVEVIENQTGIARFERGRTYFQGVVNGVPVEVDVRKGQFDITISKPTGEKLSDGSEATKSPVRVIGRRSWNGFPVDLHDTTYF